MPGRSQGNLRQSKLFRVSLFLIGAMVVAVLAACGSSENGDEPRPPAESIGTVYPSMGAAHIAQEQRAPAEAYNTVPPTSGPHWPVWADCGIYQEPLSNELQVHNLEHGFVIIQYNTSDAALVARLRDIVEGLPGFPEHYIMAPYPGMPSTIALTAWRVLHTLETVDEQAIRAFAGSYRQRGPEPGAPGCGGIQPMEQAQ